MNISSFDIAKIINEKPAAMPRTLTILPNVYRVSSIEVDEVDMSLISF